MAVGSKPALIGQHIKHTYYRGQGYFEVDIDLGATTMTSSILGMVSEATDDARQDHMSNRCSTFLSHSYDHLALR